MPGKAVQHMSDFCSRAPWWGGDLQTLRNTLLRVETALPGISKRVYFSLFDGSGDRLLAMFDEPAEGQNSPLIVLIHGLTGCEDSAYMRTSSAFHLQRGRYVLRLNLRGAGPSRKHCRGHYHAGCASDIRDALQGLDGEITANGIALIGYSLGGNVLLNLLAKHGDEFPIVCAATVSAPIDPAAAARRLMAPRNVLYHRWLLRRMKTESTAAGAVLSQKERAAIDSAKTIWEYDDRFIAPRNGFNGAEDYYARTAGARAAQEVGVPTLMIHACNDPWIPAAAYEAFEQRAPDNIEISLPPGGGHVGFHAADHIDTWHDRYIDAFLRASLPGE